eukprot:TRINITY_DN80515_c0_g1_i1.p1 TRINITY_DN80515_c0_g1~~TRINITY_DN80515_c0_g1_i1.p1  ORF type:complete len:478 (+),score=110.29 TRINITY_DN80515_c0_g1_i1:66-1436(+)
MAFALPSGRLVGDVGVPAAAPAPKHVHEGAAVQRLGAHSRQASAASLQTSAVALRAVALTFAAGVKRGRRPRLHGRGGRAASRHGKSFVARRAASEEGKESAVEDPLLAEAKAAAEAAKLQLEAEKLRAEAEQLQRSAASARLKTRAERLLGSPDAPGLGLSELITRMKETEALELTEEQGQRLAKACGLGQVPEDVTKELARAEAFNLPNVEELRQKATPQPVFFTMAELSSDAFDREVQLITTELRAAEQAKAQAAEFERKAKAANESAGTSGTEATSSTMGGVPPPGVPMAGENDDRSTGTRILASLAYLLPLAEAFRFAIPLCAAIPPLGVLFGPLAILTIVFQAIPGGSLLFFIAFIFLAQSKDVPRLTRFNLEQSVLLDIALVLPSLVLSGLEFSGQVEATVFAGAFVFFVTLGICLLCVSKTLDGKEPDDLGIISDTTKRVIDQNRFNP